jgi:pre-mRNA-splicing factor SYF1
MIASEMPILVGLNSESFSSRFAERFHLRHFSIGLNWNCSEESSSNEKVLLLLPHKQIPKMCLRFAPLERNLGEIDRAHAVYAHGPQFCDPRANSRF